MNETQTIFVGILSFAVGWALAYFFKNMGKLLSRWGLIISYFAFPLIFVMLVMLAASISDLNNTIISLIFAAGFIVRMLKR
jgi:ABC-type dipeptide/oligopeptide/nickel transport system permease subunit